MHVSVGNTYVQKKGPGGRFWCYTCIAEHEYDRLDVHDMFCFCFIPLYSQGIVRSIITCRGCGNPFEGAVLRGMTDEQLAQTRVLIGTWLGEKSVEKIQKLLTDWRVPDHQIKRLVGLALGDTVRKCPKCALSYHSSMEHCLECRGALSQPQAAENKAWDMSFLVKPKT